MSAFRAYLENVVDASGFETEKGAHFIRGLPWKFKRMLRDHLNQVDPEGLKRVDSAGMSAQNRRTWQKRLKKQLEIKEGEIAIGKAVDDAPGVEVMTVIPGEGVKGLIAMCKSAGVTSKEIAAMLHMREEEINSMVTQEDVLAAYKMVPDAVIRLADAQVFKDLVRGQLSPQTDIADKIATRRKKIILDARRDQREERGSTPMEERSREAALAGRFGVDRKTGTTIDVGDEDEGGKS